MEKQRGTVFGFWKTGTAIKNTGQADRFSKNNQISNFLSIHSLGTELFHGTERQMDRRKKLLS
jgi:hypothetical protein